MIFVVFSEFVRKNISILRSCVITFNSWLRAWRNVYGFYIFNSFIIDYEQFQRIRHFVCNLYATFVVTNSKSLEPATNICISGNPIAVPAGLTYINLCGDHNKLVCFGRNKKC